MGSRSSISHIPEFTSWGSRTNCNNCLRHDLYTGKNDSDIGHCCGYGEDFYCSRYKETNIKSQQTELIFD